MTHLSTALLAAALLLLAAHPAPAAGQCVDGLPRVASNEQGQLTLCPGAGNTTVVKSGMEVEGPLRLVAPSGRVMDLEAEIKSLRATLALLLGNRVYTRFVDRDGNVGDSTSVALTANGIPVIAYYDKTNGNLKLAVCSDPTCQSATIETVDDSRHNVGTSASLALTKTDNPIISYRDQTNGNLLLAVCNDTTCSNSPALRILDSTADVGEDSRLVLNSQGLPVVSYYDRTSSRLKLIACRDAACVQLIGSPRTVDSGGVGSFLSLALTSKDIPVISYRDITKRNLKLAICDDPTCTSVSPGTKGTTADDGWYSSVALTKQDIPMIAHREYQNGNQDGALWLTICNDASCSSWTHEPLDRTGNAGFGASLALTREGIPVVAYHTAVTDHDVDGDLRLAVCSDPTCKSVTRRALDRDRIVGQKCQLVLSSAGAPIISYYDTTNADLKLMVCSDLLCTGV